MPRGIIMKKKKLIIIIVGPSSSENINGGVDAGKLGTYVVVFDNSYSWFKGKDLRYKVEKFEKMASDSADNLATL